MASPPIPTEYIPRVKRHKEQILYTIFLLLHEWAVLEEESITYAHSKLANNTTLKKYDSYYWRTFLTLNKNTIAVSEGLFYSNNQIQESKFEDVYKNQLWQLDSNEIWGLKSTNGLSSFALQEQKIVKTGDYFEDYFISTFHKTENGTIYLGTFGDGLIVIPNKNTIEYNLGIRNGK